MSEAIVVGTDGSDTASRAVDEAGRLAKALGATLHIVSAYEPVRGPRVSGAPDAGAEQMPPVGPETAVDATLDQTASLMRQRGIEVATHAVEKDPADALLDVASDEDATMIVVGSRGMHGAKRFVLGSVPNKVSHHAKCSVLIVATES